MFEWFNSAGTRYTNTGSTNIKAGLILPGVSIFGTVGSYVHGSMSVSNLTASPGGINKVPLSWTRSGGTGVIVVRRAGASVAFTPTHGVSYAQGYTSGSDEVIYKGGAAANDTNVVAGTTYYYKAWAYNADNAYSEPSNETWVFYTD